VTWVRAISISTTAVGTGAAADVGAVMASP
jgi:hypothetical protein